MRKNTVNCKVTKDFKSLELTTKEMFRELRKKFEQDASSPRQQFLWNELAKRIS